MPLDFGWFEDPLDDLFATYSSLFISEATTVLWAMAGMLLVIYMLRHGRKAGALWFILDYAIVLLLAANILKYWATPCPLLGGYSVSGFLPAAGEYYANAISSKWMDILFGRAGILIAAINWEKADNWAMIPVAWGTEMLMWLIEIVVFGSVALAYVMIGIIRLVGPLFVPWMIFPRTMFLFWGMLQSLIQYSLFRIVAQALVFVIGTAVVTFVDQGLRGDYSLAHLALNMGKLAVIAGFSVILALRLERMTGDMVHGSSSAGSNAWTGIIR